MNAASTRHPDIPSHIALPLAGRAPLKLRWSAMARIAWGMMFHQKLKLVGTLFGVVFATLLANQQIATFLGLMHKNTMYVKAQEPEIWITAPSTQQLPPGQTISEAALMQARAVSGLEWAEPVLIGAGTVSLPAGGREPVTLIGVKLPRQAGGPWNMVAGDAAVIARPDTLTFEDSEREKLGGLNLGSVREVNGHRVYVGGFTWGLLPFGPSYAFGEYDTVRRLLNLEKDQVTVVLGKLAPGADAGTVTAELRRRLPDVQVMTRDEFKDTIISYILRQTAIGITFGTSALFGLIVGFVIVSLSMLSAVVDNLREFGTLKAVGATNWDLAKLLFVQAVTYALMGSVIGLGLVTRVAKGISGAKLSLILPLELLIGSIVVMTILCVLASSMALLRIRKLEPAMVFR